MADRYIKIKHVPVVHLGVWVVGWPLTLATHAQPWGVVFLFVVLGTWF